MEEWYEGEHREELPDPITPRDSLMSIMAFGEIALASVVLHFTKD